MPQAARFRPRRVMAAVAGLLLLGGLASAPWAQEQEQELYRVEVIVFAHPALRTSHYRWPGEPDVTGAIDLLPDAAAPSAEPLEPVFGDAASRRYRDDEPSYTTPLVPEPPAFELLAPDTHRLIEDWRRLAESRDFEPLVHVAWRQPAASFGEPQPVRLHGGSVFEREPADTSHLLLGRAASDSKVAVIDGTVALERGRFLHLRVDLAYHVPTGESHGHPLDSVMLERPSPFFTFRLTERRQIQTGVVNYFDHQRFGLIALVEEWEPVEASISPQR